MRTLLHQVSTSSSVLLAGTNLHVSPICLGTGSLGSEIGVGDSICILDAYIDHGGTFIDTAHNYGDWVKGARPSASEKAIGDWLKDRRVRSDITLATKGGHFYFDTPNEPRLERKELQRDLDGSLAALGTDYIDLYWLHRDDPERPVADIINTLEGFVRDGKIRYYGASNWKTRRISEAQAYAASVGVSGFVADQPLWNAAVLAHPPYNDPTTSWMDDERFRWHLQTGMAAIPYQSQAYGLFQRMNNGTLDKMNAGFRGFYNPEQTTARFNRMCEIMRETGLTITQVTLGYLMSQPFTTVPIIGCRNADQVADSMTALNSRLTLANIQYIEQGN